MIYSLSCSVPVLSHICTCIQCRHNYLLLVTICKSHVPPCKLRVYHNDEYNHSHTMIHLLKQAQTCSLPHKHKKHVRTHTHTQKHRRESEIFEVQDMFSYHAIPWVNVLLIDKACQHPVECVWQPLCNPLYSPWLLKRLDISATYSCLNQWNWN